MKSRRATLALTLVMALQGCGVLLATIDRRSTREGLQVLFPAVATDVYLVGEMPLLAPFALLDLPISLAYDVVLLPASLFSSWYHRSTREPRAAPPPSSRAAVPPAPIDDDEDDGKDDEAAEREVPTDSSPPQLELRSGVVDDR